MNTHPALTAGRAAVITGGASGIGLAAAKRFTALGMKVCLADLDPAALERAAAAVGAPSGSVVTQPTDVSKLADLQRLKDKAYAAFGDVAVLMNNAGTAPGGGPWDHIDRWRTVLEVNLWGVINGVQTFTQAMIDQGTPGAIISTGSKQGITTPPGDTAYNVSKAGVKVLTEALAHELRNVPGCKVSAHLLVPGFTYTGITRPRRDGKPPGAWSPEQVIDMMIERMAQGRLLHHLPGQRRHLGDGPQAHPVGGGGHHRKPPAAVALARRLQGRVRRLHEGEGRVVRLRAATNEPMPVLRSGTKGFDICRHSRFTVPTASWLTQSTGNITTSARLTRPPKSPLRSSTPPSWCRKRAPSRSLSARRWPSLSGRPPT